jgi:hypothetical protein
MTVCGTGTWTGPKPGDPDNNVTLSANTVYGGIRVSWSYPTTNAHAVAHTILYRSPSSSFSQAIQVGIVAGSNYVDLLNPSVTTQYWYWIQLVSVNGTTADKVGPASAYAVKRSGQTLEDLTGQIDEGVLAQSLKERIAQITLNAEALKAEILNRTLGEGATTLLLMQVEDAVSNSLAMLNQEVLLRVEGQNAVAATLQVLGVANDNNAAAIITEQQTRVTEDSALSEQISQVMAATGDVAAAVVTETTARTNADSALAGQITTVQSTLGDSISSVQTNMQTQINSVTGELDAIYTAKVDVNGMVGGFGIYGTATSVEAGFDVDRFWVGRTNAQKVKPFIIDNDIVYINKARIRNADIDTLKIAGNAVTVSDGASTQVANTISITKSVAYAARIIIIGVVNVPSGGFRQSLFITKNGGAETEVAYEILAAGTTACFVYQSDVSAGNVTARVTNSNTIARNAGVSILITYR